MSGIAAAIGGSKTTLWSYFPSKECLFAEVVDSIADQFQSGLIFPPSTADPREMVRIFARSFIDQANSSVARSTVRLINADGARFAEVANLLAERGPARTISMTAEWLERDMHRHLCTVDYVEASEVLMSLLTSRSYIVSLWGVDTILSGEQRDKEASRAAVMFMRCFARPEQAGSGTDISRGSDS